MDTDYGILVINPGSTSTKIAFFPAVGDPAEEAVHHNEEELAACESIAGQEDLRHRIVQDFIQRNCTEKTGAVAGRGGILKPLASGVYTVNEDMLRDLKSARYGEHASNLGAVLARRTADALGVRAFVADPPVVDELEPVSRITGLPDFQRKSIFHALNQKEAARRFAAERGTDYRELDLIVCHLGGGISVGVHRKGRVVWVNDALSGEGPFTPERAGTLASLRLLDMAFSDKYSRRELKRKLLGQGGLVAHLGTNDIRKALADNKSGTMLVVQAMALQTAREIAAGMAVLGKPPDAVIITGNMAHSGAFIPMLRKHLDEFMDITVLPGTFEMEALASAVRRVLTGIEQPKIYVRDPEI